MSIGMGLIGGFGDAAQRMGEQGQKALADQELERQRNEAVAQREASLMRLKQTLAIEGENTQRTAMVGRVNEAAGALADKQVAGKRALIDSNIADPSAWTPEQQAVVDQSLAKDKDALIGDPSVRRRAAEMTGDISPEKAATLSNSAEINQAKMDSLLARMEDKNATAKEVAQIRAEAVMSAAQLRVDAANQRATNGKIDTATGRMLITSEDVNIKAATSQIGTLNRELMSLDKEVKGPDGKRIPNPAIAAAREQMDGLRADIKTSQDNKAAYLKTMGLMKEPDAAAPAPAAAPTPKAPAAAPAAPIAALPTGARQVGTSGGKPVYETPDGKRFIGS